MTTKDQLLQQIDELVAKHTFGLDALEGIKKLKDDLSAVTAERDNLREYGDGLRRQLDDAKAAISQKDAQIMVLTKEAESMRKAVEDGKKAVYDAEKHKAVADTWYSAMAMVFKPNTVRESVHRNHTVVIPSNGGSAYTQSVQNQDNIVREDA